MTVKGIIYISLKDHVCTPEHRELDAAVRPRPPSTPAEMGGRAEEPPGNLQASSAQNPQLSSRNETLLQQGFHNGK